MNIQIQEILKENNGVLPKLAGGAFFLLFPGFFFYQSALGLEYIYGFLGGYFGVVSVVLALPLVVLAIASYLKSTKTFTLFDGVFFLIVGWIGLVASSAYVLGDLAGNLELLVWSYSGILFNIICFIIAKHLPIDLKSFLRVIFLSLLMMIVIVYSFNNDGLFYLRLSSDQEGLSTYQGFARSLAVTGLVLVSIMLKSPAKIFFISLFTAVALFLNGARSEFVLFIVGVIILTFSSILLNKKRVIAWTFIVIAAFSFGMSYLQNLDAIKDWLPQTRMLELFDLDSSSSGETRVHFRQVAANTISNNPVFGHYGSYVITEDSIGAYSHNLLSAWVNLGVFGFFLYALAIGIMLIKMLRSVCHPNDPVSRCIITFVPFLVISYILSKDYSFMIFGLTMGFCSRQQISFD